MPAQLPALPLGFVTAGHACGIKADPSTLDLSLFASLEPCTAAGVFTQNSVVGAPVKVSRERVPRDTARAVVINSGNANACTGERGLEDARWMTAKVAESLECAAEDVLVCSTGVIGHFLPREKLDAGIPDAVEKLDGTQESFQAAAQGIMTTDTVCKQSIRQMDWDGITVTVSGAAKGAAMIGPNMATMLGVIMTDAAVDSATATEMLQAAVNDSFNCISVEGHTSTSDTVILLANGAAEIATDDDTRRQALSTAIAEVCQELAQAIIRDAEGADHFVTIDVTGARTHEEAHRIAKAIAEGALVKTAITGNDPNWGRIVSAAGYCGVPLAEEDVSLRLNDTLIYEKGVPQEFNEAALSEKMASGEVHIELQLTHGEATVRFWTSDLTAEYVRLNSDYTT